MMMLMMVVMMMLMLMMMMLMMMLMMILMVMMMMLMMMMLMVHDGHPNLMKTTMRGGICFIFLVCFVLEGGQLPSCRGGMCRRTTAVNQ